MLERAVETGRLGEHRDRRGAGARVGRDAAAPVVGGVLERARGRRAQLELGDHVEPAGESASGGGGGVRRARRSSAAKDSRRSAWRTRSALAAAHLLEKPAHAQVRAARGVAARQIARSRSSQCRRAAAVERLARRSAMPCAGEAARPAMYSASPHCSASASRCAPRSRPSNTAASAARFAAASAPLRSAAVHGGKPDCAGIDRARGARRRRRHVEGDERADGGGLIPAGRAVHHPRPLDRHAGERLRRSIPPRPRRRRRSAESAAPPGWSAGPSRLNTVRTPSAARIGASAFIAGWK